MIELTKFSVPDVAARLDEPFLMANITHVGDVVVSVYICQGTVQWHRHTDVDELFWVYAGSMLLESERGDVRLRPGELTLVPKGIGHRSRSNQRASVLLLRCGFLPHRKNGKRKLYATDEDAKLEGVNLRDVALEIVEPRHFQTVARVETAPVQVGWGEGRWMTRSPLPYSELIFVLDGTATVRTLWSMLYLHPGDFTVVPKGMFYELYSSGNSILIRVTHE